VTKAILKDDEYLLNWIGQRVKDEIDIYNELIRMADGEVTKQVEILKNRISELISVANKRSIELKKQFNMADISKNVDLEKEYLTNYKTLSKLTHPSSFAVNATNEIKSGWEMKNKIIIMLQLHLGMLFKIIADYYKINTEG
jgi:hypothetical protein